MKIRFLEVTASQSPGYPFFPGQVIETAGLTPEIRAWIKSGHAEVVRDEPEAAVAPVVERAVLPRPKKDSAHA